MSPRGTREAHRRDGAANRCTSICAPAVHRCFRLVAQLAIAAQRTAGFHASGQRSARDVEDDRLLGVIRGLHATNYYAYGYRRMWKALLRAGESPPRCRTSCVGGERNPARAVTFARVGAVARARAARSLRRAVRVPEPAGGGGLGPNASGLDVCVSLQPTDACGPCGSRALA
jgi:hypothetical protein